MEAGEETEVSAGASSEETEDFYDQEDFSAGRLPRVTLEHIRRKRLLWKMARTLQLR